MLQFDHGWAAGDEEHHRLAADVLDDEGLAFMAAQSAGRLRPDHLQLADVLGVDVGQRAVARQLKVATRSRPLVRIGHSLQLLLVGVSHSRTRHTHHQSDERTGYETTLEVVHFLLLSLAYSVHRLS